MLLSRPLLMPVLLKQRFDPARELRALVQSSY